VPVATLAIGKAGARNAALLAARILALSDPAVAARVREARVRMARDVEEKDEALQQKIRSGG
jgi:phosphoribosylcarboxyaminoimidazole (NCAIR) mutase